MVQNFELFFILHDSNKHRIPYVHGRPDFRSGNTFSETLRKQASGWKAVRFIFILFSIVPANYRPGKPVDSLISVLFHPGVYGYGQKEEAP